MEREKANVANISNWGILVNDIWEFIVLTL